MEADNFLCHVFLRSAIQVARLHHSSANASVAVACCHLTFARLPPENCGTKYEQAMAKASAKPFLQIRLSQPERNRGSTGVARPKMVTDTRPLTFVVDFLRRRVEVSERAFL